MRATATSVLKLIQGSKVFIIPTFQRRYTWRKSHWQQLWENLVAESRVHHSEDQEALDGHFLGSVVLHPAPGPASTLMRHQVIDGQQRLTTILVLLAAIRDARLSEDGWNPASINNQYLINPFDEQYPDRLVPTRLDRDAYIETVRNGHPTGEIGMAYNFFRAQLDNFVRSGAGSIDQLQDTLLLRMLVVEINTKSGDSVNAIFNTLNSKGMPLSPSDLVRNEILHHVGEDESEEAHAKFWIPMEVALVNPRRKDNPDREFVTFLWSREVVYDPKVTRDSLFSIFEKRIRSLIASIGRANGEAFALKTLEELYEDHKLFLAIRDSTYLDGLERLNDRSRQAFATLTAWKSEPTTPIALWLIKAANTGVITNDDAADAVNVLLSYLVKRALSGIPTNMLNRLLTPIAHELDKAAQNGGSATECMLQILSGKAYHWPSDSQVKASLSSTPIYASARKHVKFLLQVAEDLTGGHESADLGRSQIEHILPQALTDGWKYYLHDHGSSEAEAEAVLHTLGNLTLTDSNQKLGNSSFEDKQRVFSSSAVRLNREVAELESFTPDAVIKRSELLGRRILTVFNASALQSNYSRQDLADDGSSLIERLTSLLENLDVEQYVKDEALVSILGVAIDELRESVGKLDATLVRLVRDSSGAVPDWLDARLREETIKQLGGSTRTDNWSEVQEAELIGKMASSDWGGEAVDEFHESDEIANDR